MSTVAVLGVFSVWIKIKYHASIEMCVSLRISFVTILLKIFKIGQQHTYNRKNKKGLHFLKHSVE